MVGHRIPAYYCQGCGEMTVAREQPDTCPVCGSPNLEQDPDTLDTCSVRRCGRFRHWDGRRRQGISSTYPTDVLVTGYDIIFFWVARMIFSGLEHMGRELFKYVFIHGIVRDAGQEDEQIPWQRH